jgi:hypothetical protein
MDGTGTLANSRARPMNGAFSRELLRVGHTSPQLVEKVQQEGNVKQNPSDFRPFRAQQTPSCVSRLAISLGRGRCRCSKSAGLTISEARSLRKKCRLPCTPPPQFDSPHSCTRDRADHATKSEMHHRRLKSESWPRGRDRGGHTPHSYLPCRTVKRSSARLGGMPAIDHLRMFCRKSSGLPRGSWLRNRRDTDVVDAIPVLEGAEGGATSPIVT